MKPLSFRFWQKVDWGYPDTCWLWKGHITKQGYVRIRIPGAKTDKRTFAHRLMYERWIGPIPKGKVIDHLCRVRHCLNPWHLEAVTDRENILRGVGASAVNVKKTHCALGHEFSPGNTRMYGNERVCIECHKTRNREFARRKANASKNI
jgi:hypothetical protein